MPCARFPLRAVVVVLGVVLLAYGVSPPDLQATQAPRISLDMVTSGNSYAASPTNSMTVGNVDNCLTSDPAEPADHSHFVHLIVQDVEDMVGWQARLNYIGDKMAPVGFNATPFTDGATGVGFTNLPKATAASSSHRGVIPASSIPTLPADGTLTPQTALIGAVYNGAQNFPLSPDTPPKGAAEPTTDASGTPITATPNYSAPSGGVLALVELFVQGNEVGSPLYMHLDDGNPNGPGSDVTVFTGSGTSTLSLVESALGDGFHGEGVPCVPVAPPAVALPPPPLPPPAAGADSTSADSDSDGFSDTVEPPVRTDPMRPCGIDGWPADIDNDSYSDTGDIVSITPHFGAAVPPAPARVNIAPDPPNGFVDTADIARMTGLFGTSCARSDTALSVGVCGFDETHRWAAVTSGTGPDVQGTRVWTFTPLADWSVEYPYSFWGQQAWLDWPSPRAGGLEVGFYSGWFPWPPGTQNWTDNLLPYWFIEANNPDETKRNWERLLEPNTVPAGSWTMMDAVNHGGPARVFGYTFWPHNPDGTPFRIYPMAENHAQGEVISNNAFGGWKTWMSNGAGQGFQGYWTTTTNPGLYTGWYPWGKEPRRYCDNEPYWIKPFDNGSWENGGYGEP